MITEYSFPIKTGVRWGAGRNLNLQNKVKRTYTIDRNFHKFNKKDTWKICRICSQLTTNTPKDANDSFCPTGIYLLKVTNRNTRTRCEISSKLTIKTPERCQWTYFTPCSNVSIVNFEQVNAGWGRTFLHSYALLRSLAFAKTHFMWNHSHKKRKIVWNMSMI